MPKLDARGRIRLSPELRRQLELHVGDRLVFTQTPNGWLMHRDSEPPVNSNTSQRLGFLSDALQTPEDFDSLDAETIRQLFEGET